MTAAARPWTYRLPLKSARRRACGRHGQVCDLPTPPTAEQKQTKRTFNVLPKPANLISYRQSPGRTRRRLLCMGLFFDMLATRSCDGACARIQAAYPPHRPKAKRRHRCLRFSSAIGLAIIPAVPPHERAGCRPGRSPRSGGCAAPAGRGRRGRPRRAGARTRRCSGRPSA